MHTTPFRELREDLYRRRPDLREGAAERSAALRRHYGLDLAAARRSREMTQAELADALGTTQSGVSRLERQRDTKLSTLRDYVEGTGGRLRILVEYPDRTVELPFADDPSESATAAERGARPT